MTRYVIGRFIERYKARFGHAPRALGGSLAFENKRNFQVEFIKLVRGGMNEKDALNAAARNISYGRHRIDAGYSQLEVRTDNPRDWQPLDIGDGKKQMRVPQYIEIVGRQP